MSTADLLVEIGTEELPPKVLRTLSLRFGVELESRLRGAGLASSGAECFATPRRLAVRCADVLLAQPAQDQERRGPAVTTAFGADGRPTPAALGFARSCGVALEALERLVTDKGEWLVHRATQSGRRTAELLPEFIEAALAALPIPKRMRWGDRSEEFVRPVHWVVILHGTDLVPAEILGVRSGRETRGHRFMGQARIPLASPAEYVTRLAEEGRVVADFATRRDRIENEVLEAARTLACRPLWHAELLDEVAALVEWPVPIVGSFDAHFLEVPREALVATMQGNQKYFPLETAEGSLSNRFVTVSNVESPSPELIRDGNERVIRSRLSDAAFFYKKDRQRPLAERAAQLGSIVFERRLGSLLEKTERVARLVRALAPAFGADAAQAMRAAALSRCDLVTEMVGEFPELQGTIGAYYARYDGEDSAVAQAIGEFYLPRFAGDAIPGSAAGRCIACADRLDTLVGIFSVGGAPTGDRDPYALRRAALGALRICIEGGASIDLPDLLAEASRGLGEGAAAAAGEVFDFMLERLRGYFGDHGHRPDAIEAVLSLRPADPRDIARRLAAVAEFTALPEAAALAAANKRIANILKKADAADPLDAPPVMEEPAERALSLALEQIGQDAAGRHAAGDYTGYLAALARLHDPVNAFFETVLVMAEDPALRRARLALLRRIQLLFLRVADISLVSA
jgi:glycyl-tRNA synthetase beta chain